MKLTTIFLLLAFLSVSAGGRSQVITISAKNLPFEKALAEIQKQSGYEFLYSSELIKNAQPVDLNVKNAGITEVLSLCFKNQPFQYTVIGKTVVLKLNPDPLNDKAATGNAGNKPQAPPVVVTGKVVDDEGKVLAGASVTVKGLSLGTVTDQLGNFSIAVPDNSSMTIIISYVGYEAQEYKATKAESITIVLVKKVAVGDEAIVVGYGIQKKKHLTSAVSTVTAKDLENTPYTNIYEALIGRVPGLDITRDYNPSGTDNKMLIRGKNTGFDLKGVQAPGVNISTNNFGFNNDQPLVLIDGFEGDINLINPQDIESVTVLKDASAAIYGIRAANGVILVTTKKGSSNNVNVKYDYYIGMQQFRRRPTFLPSWQQATLVNETIANETGGGGGFPPGGGVFIGGGGAPLFPYTAAEIQKFKDGSDPVNYPNTNWEDYFINKAPLQQRHNLSISGGDKRSKYSFSLEYMLQNGSVPTTKRERYGSRFNLTSQLNKQFTFTGGINFTNLPTIAPVTGAGGFFSSSSGADAALLQVLSFFSPTVPTNWANGAYSNNGRYVNPRAWLETPSSVKNGSNAFSGNVGVDWKPVKGLSVKPSLSYTRNESSSKTFLSEMVAYNKGPAGSQPTPSPFLSLLTNTLDENSTKGYNVTSQVITDYNKIFGNHEIAIMAGGMRSYSYASSLTAHAENLANSSIQTISIAPTLNQRVNGSEIESVQQSVFGRLRYNYNDLLILETTLRSDGNTAFAPENRYRVFPAVSGAWIISGHDFYQKAEKLSKTINFLKLRGSWGVLGNSSVGYFTYMRRLVAGYYSFNNQTVSGISPSDGFNEDVQWEETRTVDIGLDANLFTNKLSLSFDWYHKQTNGLLISQIVPANYGLGSVYENSGSVYNKGFEASATYNENFGAFRFNIGANAAYNTNKVLKFRNKNRSTGLDIPNDIVEGENIYTIWGLKSDGIYQSQQEVTGSPVLNPTVGPGDIRYVDMNKDGKIDGNDRVKIGNYVAPFRYGINLEAGWKGISLRLAFRGTIGSQVLMSNALGAVANSSNKVVSDYWNRWTADNHSTKFPRSWNNYQQNNPTATVSDFWLRSGNYLKLSNVTLAYNLPAATCKRIGLNNVRVYYGIENMFVVAPGFWNWLDPETTTLQANYGRYPSTSMHSFGISVGL